MKGERKSKTTLFLPKTSRMISSRGVFTKSSDLFSPKQEKKGRFKMVLVMMTSLEQILRDLERRTPNLFLYCDGSKLFSIFSHDVPCEMVSKDVLA